MAGLETLDETVPHDTDPISLGDDVIRETRQKTKTSVGAEHYLDGPHKIPHGTVALRPPAGRVGRLYYNDDTKAMEYDNGTIWASTPSDAKAKATILWHSVIQSIDSGAANIPVLFDYTIDDPGGYGDLVNHHIIQPLDSIGIVTSYIEFTANVSGGFGVDVKIQQGDGVSPWADLVKTHVEDLPYANLVTLVDSRWGTHLQVVVTNVSPSAIVVSPTASGASPRFGYALFGRTS